MSGQDEQILDEQKPNFEYMIEESSNHFKEELLQNLELIDKEYEEDLKGSGIQKLKW